MSNQIKITKVDKQPLYTKKTTGKNKLILIAILALFITPFLVAFIFFNHSDQWISSTTNKGALIAPPVQIGDIEFNTDTNAPLKIESLRGRWILFFVNSSECTESCINTLYAMNQTRLALGKKSDKVNNLFVSLVDKNNNPLLKTIKAQYPKIQYSTISYEQHQQLTALLAKTEKPLTGGGLYIIDPHGYVMMGYPADMDPNAILKDLKKIIQG